MSRAFEVVVLEFFQEVHLIAAGKFALKVVSLRA
jgi:hypothetical protein